MKSFLLAAGTAALSAIFFWASQTEPSTSERQAMTNAANARIKADEALSSIHALTLQIHNAPLHDDLAGAPNQLAELKSTFELQTSMADFHQKMVLLDQLGREKAARSPRILSGAFALITTILVAAGIKNHLRVTRAQL